MRPSVGLWLLGLLGFVLVHACSSDDSNGKGDDEGGSGGSSGSGGSGNSGGDAGDAGAPSGGASGTSMGGRGGGASGGTTSEGGTSGTAGQAGESPGGQGGEAGGGLGGQGGEGAVGPGATCVECVSGGAANSPRAVLLDQCSESPPCSAWMRCVRGCSDSECLDTCDAANEGVAPYRWAIYEALCDACSTECSGMQFCDRTCVDDVNLPLMSTAPATLAETGLYASPSAPSTPDAVARYARAFRPEYELWSDGAQKRRWAYVPKCERIGTEGINHWLFPVGTRMWKEFTIPGAGAGSATRVETRLIHKYGPNDTDWLFATYQWPTNDPNPPPSAAVLVTAGVANANGTQHDIPAVTACPQCHGSLVERVLGFGAIELSHNLGGVNIRDLADAGWLTHPSSATGALARDGFDPPGTEAEQNALGYLHANCGNCHHAGTNFGGTTPARLRLMIGFMSTFEDTDTYKNMVDVPTVRVGFNGCDRIEPHFASHSEIVMRMNRRDTLQMPPIATKQIHGAAVDAISAWINAMPQTGNGPTCTPPTN
jgi:cytochrome c553